MCVCVCVCVCVCARARGLDFAFYKDFNYYYYYYYQSCVALVSLSENVLYVTSTFMCAVAQKVFSVSLQRLCGRSSESVL